MLNRIRTRERRLFYGSIVLDNVAILDLYWHAEVIGMDLQLELGF